MYILVWTSTDAPTAHAALARIAHTITEKGKSRIDWHPVVFTAPTEAAVRDQAQAWWDAEIEKELARQGRKRGRKAAVAEPEIEEALG